MKIFLNNRPVSICRSVILLVLFSSQLTYGQSIKLPFFDDFSQTTSATPNPNLWINGGVNINNSFPINQPSVNVATFDSRNSTGKPYNFSNKFAYGTTDTLTSRPIDLSGLTPADSVYLSFYWQAKGLGELPDNDDSLVVSFLNNKNQWQTIWRQEGVNKDIFTQKLLVINKVEYLHQNFQFRFEARGRQSGAFDMWHVDFVYLNKQRSRKEKYVQEVAIQGFKNNYLKRYSAMPMAQYLINPEKETNDSVVVNMSNLQGLARTVQFNFNVIDTVSKTSYQTTSNPLGEFFEFPSKPRVNKLTKIRSFKQKGAVLKLTQKFTYEEQNLIRNDTTTVIPPSFALSNDSLSNYTPLLDYYAYDDGTAETGADTDQSLGKVAVRFILNKPDTVNAVNFNFTPYFKDITGQTFLLQIMNSANGKPAKVLHQQSVKVAYPSSINGFVKYELTNTNTVKDTSKTAAGEPPIVKDSTIISNANIAVKDTFYVAWTKVNEDVIGVGVDKNYDFGSNIFYSLGNEWVQNKSLKGSLMVRPIMGFKANKDKRVSNPLANEPSLDSQFKVFPNPTTGILRWNFENIQSISIFDATGREVFYKKTDSQEISLENLPENIYYINFSDGKKNFIRKIVVVH